MLSRSKLWERKKLKLPNWLEMPSSSPNTLPHRGLGFFFCWPLCWWCQCNGITVRTLHPLPRWFMQEPGDQQQGNATWNPGGGTSCLYRCFLLQSDANCTTANFIFSANDIMVPIWPPQKLHRYQRPRDPKTYQLNRFCILLGPAPSSIKKISPKKRS